MRQLWELSIVEIIVKENIVLCGLDFQSGNSVQLVKHIDASPLNRTGNSICAHAGFIFNFSLENNLAAAIYQRFRGTGLKYNAAHIGRTKDGSSGEAK